MKPGDATVKKENVEEKSKKRHGKLQICVQVILKKGGRGLTSVMIMVRQLKWGTGGTSSSEQEKDSGSKA